MRMNSIINRYIFKEIAGPFLLAVVFFTFVFLMAEMVRITDLIVNYDVGLLTVLQVLLFSMPFFLTFVIPMANMMAILLTFLRLSSDNEITALKTGGVSPYRMLPPVLLFSLITFGISLVMSIYWMPLGKMAIKELTLQVLSSHLDIGLKERTFIESFNDVMLYVNKIDVKDKSMIDVFIEDKREGDIVSTVIAPKGKLFSDPDNLVFHMRLYQGLINQVDLKKRTSNTISFETYDLRLDLKKTMETQDVRKRRSEMGLDELMQALRNSPDNSKRYYKILVELHKKFSIPFACLSLGLLAVPLGIQSKSSKKSSGLVLGLVYFLLFYLIMSLGQVFGEDGSYPPAIGIWLPNVIMGAMGIFLMQRTANERPVAFLQPEYWLRWLSAKFKR